MFNVYKTLCNCVIYSPMSDNYLIRTTNKLLERKRTPYFYDYIKFSRLNKGWKSQTGIVSWKVKGPISAVIAALFISGSYTPRGLQGHLSQVGRYESTPLLLSILVFKGKCKFFSRGIIFRDFSVQTDTHKKTERHHVTSI